MQPTRLTQTLLTCLAGVVFLTASQFLQAAPDKSTADWFKQSGSEKELNSDWNFLKGFVPAYDRVWTSPPLVETSDTVFAPVMGNGSMAVCVSGSDDKQVYYMRTADFWSDEGGIGPGPA